MTAIGSRTYSIPEIKYPWQDWFAILPVKTMSGQKRWLRWVRKRRVWFVIWFTEYEDVAPLPAPPRTEGGAK
jgi:hypothetical protein